MIRGPVPVPGPGVQVSWTPALKPNLSIFVLFFKEVSYSSLVAFHSATKCTQILNIFIVFISVNCSKNTSLQHFLCEGNIFFSASEEQTSSSFCFEPGRFENVSLGEQFRRAVEKSVLYPLQRRIIWTSSLASNHAAFTEVGLSLLLLFTSLTEIQKHTPVFFSLHYFISFSLKKMSFSFLFICSFFFISLILEIQGGFFSSHMETKTQSYLTVKDFPFLRTNSKR